MEIYQQLWDLDQPANGGNGCTVAVPDARGSFMPAGAVVHLQVQPASERGKSREYDRAPDPLFAQVDAAVLAKPTYAALVSLMNNYIVNYRLEETITDEESEEIDAFVEAILPTAVMQRAYSYITQSLGIRMTADEFRERIETMWFEPYTNYYNNRSTQFCSGFEHVFVGEGKYDIRFGAAERRGEISGYHNWVKFYLDEKLGRVNFLGLRYELRGQPIPTNPNVVTLEMVWRIQDLAGNFNVSLLKPKGGFFVGTSPECEIAMGTVAYFERLAGTINGDHRQTTINGAKYNLTIYANVEEDGGRGEYVRSFFPVYLGSIEDANNTNDRPTIVPVDRTHNTGDVRIVAALVNPVGVDDGREWVALMNRTATAIELAGWKMKDANGREEPLEGAIEPGATVRFMVSRSSANSMQLGNRGGKIGVYDSANQRIAEVEYGRAPEGLPLAFDL